MKQILFYLICGFTFITYSQEKEPVYSIVEELHDNEWYETQFELWKKEATEGSKSPEAWYNYYAANRALMNLTEGDEHKKYRENGKTITDAVLKMHPKSFEANYIAMWNSGLSGMDKGYLWKAYEINPDDTRLYDDLLIHYEIEQSVEKRAEVVEKMLQSNYMASGVLNWGYNLLSEVEENGIIISAGDNDTYALWLNKYGLNHRTDVTILNINMLFLEDYRERYFKQLGIAPIDTEGLSFNEMVAHVMKNEKGIPVHIATTAYYCVQDSPIDSNLYLTGLTYQYASEPIDNNSRIRRNFEQRYALDYLKVRFTYHRMDQIATSFNYTYVAAMVKLYKMYEITGETEKMKELGVLMEKVSEFGPMAEEVQKIIH